MSVLFRMFRLKRMMRMLDIIVTHYREPWEVGKPLFDMLALQHGVDFGTFRVLLINDGEENHLPDELFSNYPYTVEQVDIPHGGVSAARNAGMDYSTAEWINFCDFDDTYSNVYALRDVMNILPAKNYDFLWTQMLTEDFTNGNDVLIMTPEKSTFVFIHGKYYRRQWLIDNGIRFDTDFIFQEDSLFNAIILAVLDYHRIGKIKTLIPPYIWCRRGESVTNSQDTADKAVWGHFRRNCKLCDFYRDHLPEWRLSEMVVRTTLDTYYMVNSTAKVTLGMRKKIAEAFRKLIDTYGHLYRRPDDDTLRQMSEISRMELMDLPIDGDFDTVTQWKDMITRKVA